MRASSDDANDVFLIILGLLIGIPVGTLLYTEAAMLNWNWFAVPLGAPHLTFWPTYGLSLVMSSFRSPTGEGNRYKDKSSGTIVASMFGGIVVRFVLFAGIGYAVHTWAMS